MFFDKIIVWMACLNPRMIMIVVAVLTAFGGVLIVYDKMLRPGIAIIILATCWGLLSPVCNRMLLHHDISLYRTFTSESIGAEFIRYLTIKGADDKFIAEDVKDIQKIDTIENKSNCEVTITLVDGTVESIITTTDAAYWTNLVWKLTT